MKREGTRALRALQQALDARGCRPASWPTVR